MADINIRSNCTSNNHSFPKAQASISFHTEADACTVTFSPATGNCFGNVSSISLPPDKSLAVVPANTNITTLFTPSGCSTLAPQDTAYDITFTSPRPKPKGKSYKKVAKKKVASKKAPKKVAKKKAPAKKKVAAKKKAGAKKHTTRR